MLIVCVETVLFWMTDSELLYEAAGSSDIGPVANVLLVYQLALTKHLIDSTCCPVRGRLRTIWTGMDNWRPLVVSDEMVPN